MVQQYSIKQIAEILNVNKQRVNRFIKNNHITPVTKNGQTGLYSDTVLNTITTAFQSNTVSNEPYHKPVQKPHHDTVNNTVINQTLKTENTFLKKQLNQKDAQIKQLQQLLENQQILSLNTQKELTQIKSLQNEMPDSHSFWHRLFH